MKSTEIIELKEKLNLKAPAENAGSN